MPKLETILKPLSASLIAVAAGLFRHSSFVIRHYY
jgi:hypothetical protein